MLTRGVLTIFFLKQSVHLPPEDISKKKFKFMVIISDASGWDEIYCKSINPSLALQNMKIA